MTGVALIGALPLARTQGAVDAAVSAQLRAEIGAKLHVAAHSFTQIYQGALPDSPQILEVRTDTRPLVVVYSAAAHPVSALTAARKADAARNALGAGAAERVMETLFTGAANGRTYSVHPLLHHTAAKRPAWALQRVALRRRVFAWLREAACRTRRSVPELESQRMFADALASVDASAVMPPALRERSRQAAARLRDGSWSPATCLMHGDLWKGNILLRARTFCPTDFALIDWGGSALHGFPVVDLMRSADSLRASRLELRCELEWHADVMACSIEDTCGYLLAWAGTLLRRKDAFSAQRIATLADACIASFDLAVGARMVSSRCWSAHA